MSLYDCSAVPLHIPLKVLSVHFSNIFPQSVLKPQNSTSSPDGLLSPPKCHFSEFCTSVLWHVMHKGLRSIWILTGFLDTDTKKIWPGCPPLFFWQNARSNGDQLKQKSHFFRDFNPYFELFSAFSLIDHLPVRHVYAGPYVFSFASCQWKIHVGETCYLELIPVRTGPITENEENIIGEDAPNVRWEEIPQQDKESWCKALALRKWATIYDSFEGYSKDLLKKDYGDQGVCFNNFGDNMVM